MSTSYRLGFIGHFKGYAIGGGTKEQYDKVGMVIEFRPVRPTILYPKLIGPASHKAFSKERYTEVSKIALHSGRCAHSSKHALGSGSPVQSGVLAPKTVQFVYPSNPIRPCGIDDHP